MEKFNENSELIKRFLKYYKHSQESLSEIQNMLEDKCGLSPKDIDQNIAFKMSVISRRMNRVVNDLSDIFNPIGEEEPIENRFNETTKNSKDTYKREK